MTLTSDRPWLASYATGVPAVIEVPDEPLTAGLARTVARHPDRVALVFEGKTTTYRELAREIDRAAGALHGLGVRAGDRVAIALPNCHTHVVAFWAVLRLGAVVVEHNPTYAAAELEHQLADSGAVVAIGWEPTAARIVEVQARTAVRSVLAVDLTRDLPIAVRALTDGAGVHTVFDGVGRATFDASLASLRPRGGLALFGAASGPVPPFDPQRLNAAGSVYLTRPTIGHYIATRAELLLRSGELFAAVAAGSLDVRIGATFPLADAAEAHRALEGRATTGKVLLLP